MTRGAQGSMFETFAGRYKAILARQGVTLKVIPSEGSLENLKRLSNPKVNVDIGFVQGGISGLVDASHLMSLGSGFYVPVLVFYRAPQPLQRLPELDGKRIATGPEGSRARALAATAPTHTGTATGGR